MKVYGNYLKVSYGSGMLLVAADTPEQAHQVCLKEDNMEYRYWEDWGDERGRYNVDDSWHYSKDEFFEIPHLEWNGEPCVIAEKSYIE